MSPEELVECTGQFAEQVPPLSSYQVAPGLTFILRTVSKEAALGEYKCFSAGLLKSVNYTTTCSSSENILSFDSGNFHLV